MSVAEIPMKTFSHTTAGIIIPTFTGSISFLSSNLVMFVILKSNTNSPYHRIMFIMAFFDMAASLAIALHTIPMPQDDEISFQSQSYGTKSTCVAQGVIYIGGSGMVIGMNGVLNFYYLCKLRYRMKDDVFRKFLEPALVFITVCISLATSTYLAVRDQIGVSRFESFCTFSMKYPFGCEFNENITCESSSIITELMVFGSIGMSFLILTVTMVLIILTFYQQERQDVKTTSESNSSNDNSLFRQEDSTHSRSSAVHESQSQNTDVEHRMRKTRTVISQASMYILVFVLTWLFTVIFNLGTQDLTMQVLRVIFQPLQGFFNMIIFIYHKVYNLRRNDGDLTISAAVRLVFTQPSEIPEGIVSNVELVDNDEFLKSIEEFDRKHPKHYLSDPESSSDRTSKIINKNALQLEDVRLGESVLPEHTANPVEIGSIKENFNSFSDDGISYQRSSSSLVKSELERNDLSLGFSGTATHSGINSTGETFADDSQSHASAVGSCGRSSSSLVYAIWRKNMRMFDK